MATLSLPQLSYLQSSLASDIPLRPDSRNLTQFRPISYASSVLPGCLGSVHVTWGPISIIVGVKGQVSSNTSPSIDFHVDVLGERDDDPLAFTLNSTLKEVLDTLDLSKLVVARNRSWELFVDAIVLGKDGSNPTPAMALAVRLALLDSRLPRTMQSDSEEAQHAGEYDVDDDYGNAVPIEAAAQMPLLTIVNFVGTNILFDASFEEEAVVTGRYLLAVNESGKVVFMRSLDVLEPREGIQGRNDERGVTTSRLKRGIQEGIDVTLSIYKTVRAHIEEPIRLYETL